MAGRAQEFFSGTGNFQKKFNETYAELVIVNDGTEDLTFTANRTVFTIKPGEVFDEKINPFESIDIETASSFRGFVREGE